MRKWNAIGVLSLVMMGLMSYVFFGCSGEDEEIVVMSENGPVFRTIAEINAYAAQYPFQRDYPDAFAEDENGQVMVNDPTQGKSGKLSDGTLSNALNALNFIRFEAGLEAAEIQESYQTRAQAGAALSAWIGGGHYPKKEDADKAGIPESFFKLGSQGTGASNMTGGGPLGEVVIGSFMPDPGNDSTGLAHRSYCINPALKFTGFGRGWRDYTNPGAGGARLMHATDWGRPNDILFVPWPAQHTALEHFSGPWSFFVNSRDFVVEREAVTVTLKTKSETEVLDKESTDWNFKTKGSYGMAHVIIFRPSLTYEAGDIVSVSIDGIKNKERTETYTVRYDVRFFNLGDETKGASKSSFVVTLKERNPEA